MAAPPTVTLSGSGTVAAGGTVTVTGSGFQPSEPVNIVLNDPVTFTTTADATGAINDTITIPSTVPAGSYTMTITGQTSDLTTTVNITVTASTSTSSTTTSTPGTPIKLTGAYELYCPGTPVGNILLNNVMTVATPSVTSISSGQTFSLGGYQTSVNLPATLASAAAALGSATLSGSATGQLDVAGATPATLSTGKESFSLNIPSPVPAAGLTLTVPTTPSTLGPFTSTGSAVTVQEDSSTALELVVSGAPLDLNCTSYANDPNAVPGLTTSPPTGNPISPVIATIGGGTSATTSTPPPATKPGSTPTTKPVTAPSSSLAFTGPGPGVGVIGILGGVLVLMGIALLVLVDVPRRAVMRMAVVGPAQWQRVRGMDVSDRLANLNPMRWRRASNEGVPDAAATAMPAPMAPSAPAQGPVTATGVEASGDRIARTTEMGRDLAVNTTRAAVRAADWLLGR